ncbi:hypothetical protein FBY34_8472 [Streptomyces sp. SLBN-115]|nr:hypothetical protein FBY34_8472 [Streptomyces sp. SLBN-115]
MAGPERPLRRKVLNPTGIGADRGRPQGPALLEDLEPDVADAPDVNVWLCGAWMKPFALALLGCSGAAAVGAERAHAGHRQVDEHALVSHPAVQRVPLVLSLSEAGRPAEALRGGRARLCRTGCRRFGRGCGWRSSWAVRSGWPGILTPPAAGGRRMPRWPGPSTTADHRSSHR